MNIIKLIKCVLFIVVSPKNEGIEINEIKFPKPGEDFNITCTVGRCK